MTQMHNVVQRLNYSSSLRSMVPLNLNDLWEVGLYRSKYLQVSFKEQIRIIKLIKVTQKHIVPKKGHREMNIPQTNMHSPFSVRSQTQTIHSDT